MQLISSLRRNITVIAMKRISKILIIMLLLTNCLVSKVEAKVIL